MSCRWYATDPCDGTPSPSPSPLDLSLGGLLDHSAIGFHPPAGPGSQDPFRSEGEAQSRRFASSVSFRQAAPSKFALNSHPPAMITHGFLPRLRSRPSRLGARAQRGHLPVTRDEAALAELRVGFGEPGSSWSSVNGATEGFANLTIPPTRSWRTVCANVNRPCVVTTLRDPLGNLAADVGRGQ